eukprot:scaffold165777_cov33-Tisochrysis_lutea.AAC.4
MPLVSRCVPHASEQHVVLPSVVQQAHHFLASAPHTVFSFHPQSILDTQRSPCEATACAKATATASRFKAKRSRATLESTYDQLCARH